MIWFILVALIYVASLALIRPLPESLKDRPVSVAENIRSIKGTIALGLLLSSIFLITSNYTFKDSERLWLLMLGVNNVKISALLPFQIITSSFAHWNWLHLVSNLGVLGVTSLYERRVGALRFFAVFMAGGIFSVPSVLFYSKPILICGASGGILALAAAYFADYGRLTGKEWLCALGITSVILLVFFLNGQDTLQKTDMDVDNWGHVLGAAGGLLFCRMFPRSNTDKLREKNSKERA